MKKNVLYSIFAMAIMSLTVLTSCSDDSPSGVVKTYFSAMKSGDAKKAAMCTNVSEDRMERRIERFEKKFSRNDANMQLIKEGKVKILNEKIDDDRAFVEVFVEAKGGMGIQMELDLEKVDGQWKIDE